MQVAIISTSRNQIHKNKRVVFSLLIVFSNQIRFYKGNLQIYSYYTLEFELFFPDEAQSHLRTEEQEAKLSIGEEHNEKHHSETANVLATLSNQQPNINNHID